MIRVDVDAWGPLKRVMDYSEGLTPFGVRGFLKAGVHPYLQNRIDKRFASEGDEVVGKWTQLALATGMIRASQGFPAWHPINKRTGELHQWVRSTYTISGGSVAQISVPGRGGRLVEEKFRVAQQGGGKKGKKSSFVGPRRPAPPRPVIALGLRDSLDLTISLMAWIQSGGITP